MSFGFPQYGKGERKFSTPFHSVFDEYRNCVEGKNGFQKYFFPCKNHQSNFSFQKSFFSLPRHKKSILQDAAKNAKKNKPKYRILKTDFFEKEKSTSPPQAMLGNTFAAREQKKAAESEKERGHEIMAAPSAMSLLRKKTPLCGRSAFSKPP